MLAVVRRVRVGHVQHSALQLGQVGLLDGEGQLDGVVSGHAGTSHPASWGDTPRLLLHAILQHEGGRRSSAAQHKQCGESVRTGHGERKVSRQARSQESTDVKCVCVRGNPVTRCDSDERVAARDVMIDVSSTNFPSWHPTIYPECLPRVHCCAVQLQPCGSSQLWACSHLSCRGWQVGAYGVGVWTYPVCPPLLRQVKHTLHPRLGPAR